MVQEMSLVRTHMPEPTVVKMQRKLVDVGVGTPDDWIENVCRPPNGTSFAEKYKCQEKKVLSPIILIGYAEQMVF